MINLHGEGEGEGEDAVFSAKRWDRRIRAGLIESATPCHDAQVVGSYRGSNPLRLTVLASKSEDYTTAPQHLQMQLPKLRQRIITSKKINFMFHLIIKWTPIAPLSLTKNSPWDHDKKLI